MELRENLKLIVNTKVQFRTNTPQRRDVLWNHAGTRGLHLRGSLVVRVVKRNLKRPDGLNGASVTFLEFPQRRRSNTEDPRPMTARALHRSELSPELLQMIVDECRHDGEECTEKSARQVDAAFYERAGMCADGYRGDMEPDPRELLREWMKVHGLTVRGWCKAAKLSSSALQGYVKEGSSAKAMNVDSVAKLARAVGVPLHILVLYTGGHLPGDPLPPLPAPNKDADQTEAQLAIVEAIVAGLRRPK